jgi:hypothetical protein
MRAHARSPTTCPSSTDFAPRRSAARASGKRAESSTTFEAMTAVSPGSGDALRHQMIIGKLAPRGEE